MKAETKPHSNSAPPAAKGPAADEFSCFFPINNVRLEHISTFRRTNVLFLLQCTLKGASHSFHLLSVWLIYVIFQPPRHLLLVASLTVWSCTTLRLCFQRAASVKWRSVGTRFPATGSRGCNLRFKLETDSDGEFTCSVRFYQRPPTRCLTNGAPAESYVCFTDYYCLCGDTLECLHSIDVWIFFACALE